MTSSTKKSWKTAEEKPITLYCGFDPTADSLHIGHLVPIITLMIPPRRHRVIALVGSGTGLVGTLREKVGKDLNDEETVHEWSSIFRKQIERFLPIDGKTAYCMDNYQWLGQMKALDLLREYGRHFSINIMLAKESVKSRLEEGLTYLEFSYMIMQSIDFLKMYQHPELHCEMQIGGQDQWGNITSGVDLIRKIEGPEAKAYALTMPLVLKVTERNSKTEGARFGLMRIKQLL